MPAICLAQVEKRERALQPHAERRVAASHGGGGGRTDPTSAQAARVRGVIARMLDLGFPEGRVWLGFREKGGGV